MARSLFRDVMLPVCEALAVKVAAVDQAGDDWSDARKAQMIAHQSFALMLGALWERELQDYLFAAAAIIIPDDVGVSKDIKSGSIGRLAKAFLAIRGFPLSTFPMLEQLQQLHLITSAVRHGVGPSSERLLKDDPSLFAPALVTDWFAYFTESTDPASASRLDSSMDRLAGYAEAVASFWEAIDELRGRTPSI